MVSSFSASCSRRPLVWRIRHSHLTHVSSTLFHSLVPSWHPRRIRPQITHLSQLENSEMGTWPIYKNYYTRLVRKMAWYKILIHVLIVQFLRITICLPYWWCTKHAQLIMGIWPIYKNTLLITDLNKKLSLIKYLLTTIFFLSFQSVLVNVKHRWGVSWVEYITKLWYSYVWKPRKRIVEQESSIIECECLYI